MKLRSRNKVPDAIFSLILGFSFTQAILFVFQLSISLFLPNSSLLCPGSGLCGPQWMLFIISEFILSPIITIILSVWIYKNIGRKQNKLK